MVGWRRDVAGLGSPVDYETIQTCRMGNLALSSRVHTIRLGLQYTRQKTISSLDMIFISMAVQGVVLALMP
jgi:hypothetical protein